MTGSFDNYSDAISYRSQMRSRGFEDAFVVTFKDGERVPLNKSISTKKNVVKEKKPANKQKQVQKNVKKKNDLVFVIQIGVFPEILSPEDLSMMSKINNVKKESTGSFYKYYSENFSEYSLAASKLQKIKSIGFADAFIISNLNGKEISLEKALNYKLESLRYFAFLLPEYILNSLKLHFKLLFISSIFLFGFNPIIFKFSMSDEISQTVQFR
tara:strand:- start:18 stop:656 length:639 start_codon:yes stop_codon:yes gene_type:complete